MKEFLTPSALTDVLRSNGHLRNAEITEVQSEQIGQNFGFNGGLWRLKLSFNSSQADVPNTMIAKFALNPSVAEKLESEARFYRDFGTGIGIRTPRHYVAQPGMLLLEDLSSLKCGDVVTGCSADEALLFVHHLARFHATGWLKSSITNNTWLPTWPIQSKQFYDRFSQFHAIFLEQFEESIPNLISDMTI